MFDLGGNYSIAVPVKMAEGVLSKKLYILNCNYFS